METLIHKTYGVAYVTEDLGKMCWVALKTPHHLPGEGLVTSLVVGKSALHKAGSDPKPQRLSAQYLPLAKKVAAETTWFGEDYEERLSMCAMWLVELEEEYKRVPGNIRNFGAVAITSLKNMATDKVREDMAMKRQRPQGHAENPTGSDFTDDDRIDLKSAINRVKLTDREFKVLKQFFFKDRKNDEIAESMDTSNRTVKRIKLSAINKLRKEMGLVERNVGK